MAQACSALPGVEPHMRPGQAQRLAQESNQEGSVFDLPRHGTPIDLDIDLRHFAPSPFWYTNTLHDCGLARNDDVGLHRSPGRPRWRHRHVIQCGRNPLCTVRPTTTFTPRIAALPGASPKVPVSHLP